MRNPFSDKKLEASKSKIAFSLEFLVAIKTSRALDRLSKAMDMESIEWDDGIHELSLGLRNIFDEISLDFLDITTEPLNSLNGFYEPKSRDFIQPNNPP